MLSFQHTAARRRLVLGPFMILFLLLGFNTQPPEGGWGQHRDNGIRTSGFNTQPPEGGWKQRQTDSN